jgi:demethylmenaquinone methyltransferase/2-methoxy-6-polyprenyl-1,4-benzoquinol methylase
VTSTSERPRLVAEATERAARRGFEYSCEEPVGPLLATLAAAVPTGGRILELGTGAGVGTAWILAGLGARTDVTVRTVEFDPELAAAVRATAGWPAWTEVLTGDAELLVQRLGRHDLIFADATGGKWTGLRHTIAALAPGGVLLVDDMELSRYTEPEHRASVTAVREALAGDPRLVTVELPAGSGLILSTRSRD